MPLDIFHDQIVVVLILEAVEHQYDIWMLQFSQHIGLAQKELLSLGFVFFSKEIVAQLFDHALALV
ncbi:MAG: hypothetical protein BWY75_01295 [bacterium ADurb.Bin425]|nr:MAG: hypothetical protein BWY75_01295 [bacterium ADurb.Bin425]